eukprot:812861-Prorocentrum_lima.AAC.1
MNSSRKATGSLTGSVKSSCSSALVFASNSVDPAVLSYTSVFMFAGASVDPAVLEQGDDLRNFNRVARRRES